MWLFFLLLALLLLLLALWLARLSERSRRRSGLPQGRLIFADTARWSEVSRPFFSRRYQLAGKPDYLVETDSGLVPVEVKRTGIPPDGRAYDSHIMQLAAYCLLVEDAYGQPPPHGLIHYAGATIQIDYTPDLREALLALLDEMRARRSDRDVARSHNEAARCRGCGLREACGKESLA